MTPADGTAAQDACLLSSDTAVSGTLSSQLAFSFTLHYESGASVAAASAPSLSLSEGDGALLVAEVDCGQPLASGDTTHACAFELAHLGALVLGLSVQDSYLSLIHI